MFVRFIVRGPHFVWHGKKQYCYLSLQGDDVLKPLAGLSLHFELFVGGNSLLLSDRVVGVCMVGILSLDSVNKWLHSLKSQVPSFQNATVLIDVQIPTATASPPPPPPFDPDASIDAATYSNPG